MFRWFADLPIERKLRVVITVPAMAAFAIAIAMHIATNLLHLRAEMQQRAAAIGRTAGVSGIEALSRGDTAAAISALTTLRDEPMVDIAEVYLPNGRKIATYDRAADGVFLDPAAHRPACIETNFKSRHLPRMRAQCSATYISSCPSHRCTRTGATTL